jgi:cold shock protein
METGTVKSFNDRRGFGFVTTDSGEELFFHRSDVKNSGFRDMLYPGDPVRFDVRNDRNGRRACNIFRIQG